MIAILLAAQLSASLASDPAASQAFTRSGLPVHPEVFCEPGGATRAAVSPSMLLRPQDRRDARARKLADLPKADKEIAVARTIGGCAVPVGVRYSVEGDGRFANGK